MPHTAKLRLGLWHKKLTGTTICRPGQDLIQAYFASFTAGGFQVPSMIEGGVSFGQYRRIMGMNFAFGAGSQLASFALPGESAWRYRSTEPSAFVMNLLRWLKV